MTKAKKTVGRQSKSSGAADEDEFLRNESVGGRNASSVLDLSLEPINSPEMAFGDMVKRFCDDLKLIADNGGISIKIATMCSGTEAPIFALQMLKEAFDGRHDAPFLHYDHKFSVEIVPFKQAYLERNTARSNTIFRDVRDFKSQESKEAFTPLGFKTQIPKEIDVLVAGTSCVDFSTLNNKKQSSMGIFLDQGYKLVQEWRDWVSKIEPKVVKRPRRSTQSANNMPNGTNQTEPRPNYWRDVLEYVLNFGELSEEEADSKAFGQSTLTFLSLLNYAHWHRPKVIILENVNGAPWKDICGFFFRAIGYRAVYEHVDSKEFYTPQTRTRGYAVAVDLNTFGADADGILTTWESLMSGELRRRASSSISKWLLPPNDPLALRARQSDTEAALSKSKRKETDWDRSELRHNRTRRDLQLGQGNPITAWKLGTDHPPYDRMDRLIKGLWSTRALDCVDMIHLSCLKTGANSNNPASRFDMRFKTQIYDISQNIDRTMVSKNFGVSVCLTPNGAAFITDQVRPVSGYEYLRLQGLPLQSLDLLKEDQDQLRDLGGNAMTTTVIGAAFLALFRSLVRASPDCKWFASISSKEGKLALEVQLDDDSVYKPLDTETGAIISPKVHEVYSSVLHTRDQDLLIAVAQRARRYCYCSQGAKYSSDHLKRCKECGTIRCQACFGNPRHYYQDYPAVQNPILYDTVLEETMKYLPVGLHNIIGNTKNEFCSHFDCEQGESFYQSLVSSTFYFEEILVTEQLTVCYSTRDAECVLTLQCVIDGKKIIWYLYLAPWCPVGQGLRRGLRIPRDDFSHPFARLSIEKNTVYYIPTLSMWDLWKFEKASCTIKVTRPQPEQMAIEVHPASIEKSLHLQRIEGLYNHRPECDVAENSLYVLEENSFGERIFLFKDPTKIMAPELDCFVIAPECRVLESHEFRQQLFTFPQTWNLDYGDEDITGCIPGYWCTSSGEGQVKSQSTSSPDCVGKMLIPTQADDGRRIYFDQHFQLGMKPLLLAELVLPQRAQPEALGALSKYRSVRGDEWALVPKKEYSAVFGHFAPLNTALHHEDFKAFSFTICDNGTDGHDFQDTIMPPVEWLQRKGVDNVREPYRSSEALELYELEVRSRRQGPFKVLLQSNDESEMKVRYCIQPDELVLDAASFLRRASRTMDPIRTLVEVSPGELNLPQMRFSSFKNCLKPLPPVESRVSAAFINDKKLSPQQEVSLTWMFNLEREGETAKYKYTEQEIQEHGIEALNLRIAGTAQTDVVVQGGVLADQVGYGKTIISLALMQKGEDGANFDSGESLTYRQLNNAHVLALSCSLVIAPKHLVAQWSSEAHAFLGWATGDVVTINSLRDLKPRSGSKAIMERLKKAKLLIVSTEVFELSYFMELAKYAGTFGPPSPYSLPTAPKDDLVVGAFKHWYEHAIERARQNVDRFDPQTFNLNQLDVIKSQMQDLVSKNTALLDDYHAGHRHLDQTQAGQECGQCAYESSNPTAIEPQDFTTSVFHMLEAFSYARVFYDEFSYENPCASYFFKNTIAHSKWVLSATAPTADLKAVCSIAELLGVHVARPAMMRPGLPLITRGPADLSRSSADEHLAYNTFHSDKGVQLRMSQGTKFLEKFASANAFDQEGFGAIQVTQTVHVCSLTLGELAGYLDLLRALRDADFEVKKTLTHSGLQYLNASDKTSAGELLAYTASVFSGLYYVSPRTLLQRRLSDLVLAQRTLKKIIDVSIWLALRRNKEIRRAIDPSTAKTNPSATSAIEDLVHFFQVIRNEDVDILGGTDELNAISRALFVDGLVPSDIPAVHQFTDDQSTKALLRWLDTITSSDSSPFFRSAAWASYLPITEKDINTTSARDVADLLRDLRERLDVTEMSESIRETFADLQLEDIGKFTLGEQRQLLIYFLSGVKSVKLRVKKKPAPRKRTGVSDAPSVDAQYDEVFETAKFPMYGKTTKVRGSNYTETEAQLVEINMELNRARDNVAKLARQVRAIESLFYGKQGARMCYVCKGDRNLQLVPECGHIVCAAHIADSGVRVCGDIQSSEYPRGSGCSALLKYRVIPVEQLDHCQNEEEQHLNTEKAPEEVLTHEEMNKRDWNNLPNYYQDKMPDPHPDIIVEQESTTESNSNTSVAASVGGPTPAHNALVPYSHHLSTKTIAIIEKIHHIVAHLNQRALVFYQFERQLAELRDGLERIGIPHQVLSAEKKPRNQIQDDGMGPGSAVKFMKINGVEAAGSNLQDANHVIFTSAPVFSRQEDFDAYVNQAKGRAIRHGQKNDVHVYWYLSANTFEIDLLQLRLRSHIRLPHDHDEAHVIPWDSEDTKDEETGIGTDDNIQYVNITSSLSKDEVWRLTDETNWLVQQAIEF
ncbi:hypothetical protein GGR57DRAFT_515110 [Xylariaceae sp. FL1272]|nr:hypothetical protein GGR57DRAFT_515110 [Xylariaceae sp. FL1272]